MVKVFFGYVSLNQVVTEYSVFPAVQGIVVVVAIMHGINELRM